MKNMTVIKWNGLAITTQCATTEDAMQALDRWQKHSFYTDGKPFAAVFIIDSETGEVAWDHKAYLVRCNLLRQEVRS